MLGLDLAHERLARAPADLLRDLCERFGKETYLAALQALLDRTYEAMRTLIQLAIPEEPQSFEDYIDDDGLGNGPFKMKLTIWREGDHAYFDWTGTDPQALGPINFYLSEGMFKMFIGIYLIRPRSGAAPMRSPGSSTCSAAP